MPPALRRQFAQARLGPDVHARFAEDEEHVMRCPEGWTRMPVTRKQSPHKVYVEANKAQENSPCEGHAFPVYKKTPLMPSPLYCCPPPDYQMDEKNRLEAMLSYLENLIENYVESELLFDQQGRELLNYFLLVADWFNLKLRGLNPLEPLPPAAQNHMCWVERLAERREELLRERRAADALAESTDEEYYSQREARLRAKGEAREKRRAILDELERKEKRPRTP